MDEGVDYADVYPPAHLDLDRVQNRVPPQSNRMVREYKANSRGVHGRGSHMPTMRGAEQKGSYTRAALIFFTVGTCGLGLPVWLTWEVARMSYRVYQGRHPTKPVPIQLGTNATQIRVAMMLATLFSCGLALPVWLTWEVINGISASRRRRQHY